MLTGKTTPQNYDFFGRYCGLISKLKILGYVAQVISAVTEAGAIYALALAAVSDIVPAHAHKIAIFTAFLGVLVIEGGARALLPYTMRAFLFGRFGGLDALMSAAVISLTLAIVAASAALSFQGAREIVATATPPAALESTASADAQRDAENLRSAQQYDAEISALTSVASAQGAQVKAQSAQKAKALRSKYANDPKGLYAALDAIKTDERAALAQIDAERAKSAQAAQAARAQRDAATAQKYADVAQKIEHENDRKEADRAAKIAARGGGFAWFTVVCLFFLVFVILLDEAHKKGSGVEDVTQPTQRYFSQGVFSLFAATLAERADHAARAALVRWGLPAPLPPTPAPALHEQTNAPPEIIPAPRPPAPALDPDPADEHTPAHADTHADAHAHTPTHAHARDNATVSAPETPPEREQIPGVNACENCNALMVKNVAWQRFCSEACKLAYHARKHDGQKFDPARRGRNGHNVLQK